LQAYREYQEAVQEAERKKPEGLLYKIAAEDGSGHGRLIYDPAAGNLELDLSGCRVTIPGKYLSGIQSALNTLMEAK